MQAGPDTGIGDFQHCAGYKYEDNRILGFSQTHLSGTGCASLGDIRLVPLGDERLSVDQVLKEGLAHDRASERATPGFYAVRLEGGVAVEATAAPHTALYRFTFDGQGGNEKFVAKLDNLFELPSEAEGQGWEEDCTGFIGQYIHGNEPSHHVAYFYTQAGHPEKTAERVREVLDKFYAPRPDGLCGNDDCGQMSAWYLFSLMGFYPFDPCGGEYVIGAPQIKKMTIRCTPTPDTSTFFTITAKNLSRENKYVKSVTLNGKPVTDWKIRHADILRGGVLEFEMQAKPEGK